MDHPDFIVLSFMENSIGLKRVNMYLQAEWKILKILDSWLLRSHPIQPALTVIKTGYIWADDIVRVEILFF